MKKPISRMARSLAVFLLLSACGKNNTDSTAPAPAPTPQRGALLQSPVQVAATYTPADLSTLLAGNELGKILLNLAYTPKCTITVYHIEYQTVDASNALTPASGALMLPSGSADCQGGRPVLLYAHGTNSDKSFNIASLSTSNNGEGLVMAAIFAAQGYIVVAPNYVGYDISTAGYHPYLLATSQSDDMIDALTAARSALPTSQVPVTTDGGKLFISGYSEGGYVAMATHRAMQAAGMTVTAAAPMSGPYTLSELGDAIFEGQVNASGVLNVTLLAAGYQRAYGNIYTSTSDVFNPAYATGIDNLLPSTTSVADLTTQGKLPPALFDSTPPTPELAPYTPATQPAHFAPVFAAGFGTAYLVNNAYRQGYLQDAFANPDGAFPTVSNGMPPATPANTLRVALKANDLRTWGPTAPVLLCGGENDPTVFFFATQTMQNYWSANFPTAPYAVLDVDSAPVGGDPYADLKSGFAAAETALRVVAVAGGATDNGDAAVLADYHAGLVPPFCLSAAKSFFDAH